MEVPDQHSVIESEQVKDIVQQVKQQKTRGEERQRATECIHCSRGVTVDAFKSITQQLEFDAQAEVARGNKVECRPAVGGF